MSVQVTNECASKITHEMNVVCTLTLTTLFWNPFMKGFLLAGNNDIICLSWVESFSLPLLPSTCVDWDTVPAQHGKWYVESVQQRSTKNLI